jgi:histidinol-phosphate aminotransferase
VALGFDGIVVVDEAYVDFSATPSACCLIDKHENIVVMQTLSKAFGLAGIRIGMALGPKEIIHHFNSMKAPYNINKLTSELAHGAFDNIRVMKVYDQERVKEASWCVLDDISFLLAIVFLVVTSHRSFNTSLRIIFSLSLKCASISSTGQRGAPLV